MVSNSVDYIISRFWLVYCNYHYYCEVTWKKWTEKKIPFAFYQTALSMQSEQYYLMKQLNMLGKLIRKVFVKGKLVALM